ncbi:YbeD family protein [Singulisphaera sp. PoT]|uniref:YbeD family protein n=1 Tax=Singulisphaera sp. PoT TaxID=3411797 RepID=UPI003BF4CC2F
MDHRPDEESVESTPNTPEGDHRPSEELLESTHPFPGTYQIKAIGNAEDDFEQRVVEVVISELVSESEFDYTVRRTPGGRHVALTLDITVQSAEHVRGIYARIREIPGLTLLL